ncbi:MAG: coproporphyrinogen dehydrogenase HemZ [Clostridia bacterium]|nr:coproporphyrinogen dehydrogenase HemZ [Clostridia bacterium]
MVQLITNAKGFYNDMTEEVRLFLGQTAILPYAPEAELRLFVILLGDEAKCLAMPQHVERIVPVQPGADVLDVKRQQKRALKLCVYQIMQALYPVATPWGSLTGIRPTKLFREIAGRQGMEEAKRSFRELFTVSPQKQALVEEITEAQRPHIESIASRSASVYLHIPFCRSRCLYCSFGAEVAKREGVLSEYADHLILDIRQGAELLKKAGYSIRTFYFGGGTPTVLSAAELNRVLTALDEAYGIGGREFTVEAGRPDTITREKLRVLKAHGISRISINPQTMNDRTLQAIGRFHTAADIAACFELARQEGFDCINMDLIAGLPGEDVGDFARTLAAIQAFAPENLTVHTLAIKHSSRLKARLEEYPLPKGEAVEEMVRMGAEAARQLGMKPYYMYRQKYMQGNLENVGYAKPGTECVYNIDMMEETVSIMAHGAGSMTKRVYGVSERVERLPSPKDVPTWYKKQDRLFSEKKRLFSD